MSVTNLAGNTDVLKKAVGEDTLIYEKKGQDAIHFHSYAKLLFSTNEMPQNLEDKSDAFYRRLLILDMNRVVKSGEKDLHLKEKVQAESDYAIHMAMIALKNLYEQGKFTESEHSKECVREVQRTSDSICAFIDESLVRAKGKRLKRSEVFHMYEEYCKENGRQGHGKSNFFRNMTDKEFCAEKTQDEDYYVLTLAAIARELDGKGMNRAKVHIAAGLPLTWVAIQKEDFQKYLLQNECVDFTFRNKEYRVEFAGADIYPQGFAAAFYRLQDFKGINMLVDIGNGTMNIMYINNSRPLEKKCFTEKYGTHQCVLAVRESLLKELGTVVDDLVIEQVIRTGTADIGEKYLTVIRKAAGDYTKEIFHKLREREYNPELMRLYVVGGGGCMIQNFGEYDKNRVTIVRDICATAKGYEAMTVRKIQRNGGMLV